MDRAFLDWLRVVMEEDRGYKANCEMEMKFINLLPHISQGEKNLYTTALQTQRITYSFFTTQTRWWIAIMNNGIVNVTLS